MATEIINGLTVEMDGDGEATVLCIHGLGGSSNTWTPVMPAFEGKRVIRPDLPGSARSPLRDRKLSIDEYVLAMQGLLEQLALSEVHVVAHSMGTIVAQHLALRSQRVRSLALFGPLVSPPDAGRAGIRSRAELARTGDAGIQQIADAVVKAATSKETKAQQPAVLALVRESVMRQTPEGYAQSCEALAGAQAAEIEGIRVPTLLVTGDQDGVAPAAAVELMHGRIASSTFVVFDGCGHWTTYEQPKPCIAELQKFHAGLI